MDWIGYIYSFLQKLNKKQTHEVKEIQRQCMWIWIIADYRNRKLLFFSFTSFQLKF